MVVWDNPQAGAAELTAAFEALPLAELLTQAEALTLAGHGPIVTYSRKVFIPLTQLCRDVCHYCTFAQTPAKAGSAFLDREAVLAIARAGAAMGCREALFTLGDKPEARYAAAREALAGLGHETTLSYLAEVAALVFDETGLLPHLNPGLMDAADYAALRPHAASMGIMLESASPRLCDKGEAHHGSPDKEPARRLAAIAAAGEAQVPFTTGLLIGIGETRQERIEALLAIRDLHRRYGHIQEVIIQNFRAKPGTRMADRAEPTLADHAWTIAAARLVLGPDMTIQAPPNLHDRSALDTLIRAGRSHPRGLAARGHARGSHARSAAGGFPGPAEAGRTRDVAGHCRRNPRSRRPRDPVSGQGERGRVAAGDARGAQRRLADHRNDHVRPR